MEERKTQTGTALADEDKAQLASMMGQQNLDNINSSVGAEEATSTSEEDNNSVVDEIQLETKEEDVDGSVHANDLEDEKAFLHQQKQ